MAVYFIQAGETGPVKIGIADDVAERLRALQTAHWELLHVRHVFDGGAAKERAFHERYKAHRLRGEWFDAAILVSVEDIDAALGEQRPCNQLGEYLSANSITVARFGAMIGVEGASVARYATGQRIPRRAIMQRIMAVTNGAVDPSTFYPGNR